MQILDFLKEKLGEESLENIKLAEVAYAREGSECVVTFTYPDDERYKPSDEKRSAIQEAVTEFVSNICKAEVRFKKSFVDSDMLKSSVVKFLSDNYAAVGYGIDASQIEIDCLSGDMQVTLPCTSSVAKYIEQKQILSMLEREFSRKLGQELSFGIKLIEPTDSLEEVLATQDRIEQNSLESVLQREIAIHKIEVLEKLFGREISDAPIFVEDIKTDLNYVVVAGRVKYFSAKTYVPKKKLDSGEAQPERQFFSFSLEDPSGLINIVHFPTLATTEHIARLNDNMEIVVSGRVERYNDRLSLRAADISFCKLSGEGKKVVYRSENPDYLAVKPASYIEKEQLDLFGNSNAGTSPFWQDKSVVVFDFETTGLDHLSNHIIEIGAVKVVNGKIVETFSTLVNPKSHIPEDATRINHISDEMVADAPSIDKVLPDFFKFTRGCVLSAYNIDFDYNFLRVAATKQRFNFDNEQIDTLILARNKLRGLRNYKLGTVAKALDVSLENAHRALDDTIATAKIFIKLI